MEEGAESLHFGDVFNKMKSTVIKHVATVLSHKQSMEIKLGIKFEAGQLDLEPFQDDEETEPGKPYICDIKDVIWSVDPITCTKANIKTIVDEQYSNLHKK